MLFKIFSLVVCMVNLFAFNESELRKELANAGVTLATEAPLRYVVYMNIYNEGEGFSLPLVNFYNSSDTAGKPAYSITKRGFYKGSKLLCPMLTKKIEGRKGMTKEKFLDHTCTGYLLKTDATDGADFKLLFLEDFDKIKKVAKVKIFDNYYYVNLEDLKGLKINKPTHLVLSESLLNEDRKKIDLLLSNIRKHLLNRDYESFKKALYSEKKRFDTLYIDYESFTRYFTRKNINKKVYFNSFIESTYLDILSHPDSDQLRESIKKNHFCLNTTDDNIKICLTKENEAWYIYSYRLLDMLYL